jgi:hypothetical protein
MTAKLININLSTEIPQKPYINLKGRKSYIEWGRDNLYPSGISDLLHFSTIHQSIIKLKSNLTSGDGFIYPEGYTAPPANPKESIDEIEAKIAIDKVVYNGYAMQVVYGKSAAGTERKIVEIYHTDVSKVRASHPNEEGVVLSYWISQDWTNVRKYPPAEIPAFDPSKRNEDRQLIYVFDYTPGLHIYPCPDYSAAINYINLDYEISIFHLNNVRNGMTPSLHINIPQIPTDEERRDIKRDFEEQYRGSENAGKFLISFSHGDELAPKIDTISANNNADLFNTLNDITAQKIITAHRLASPVLAGLAGGSNSLGSNGGEIVAANQYFMSSVIKHYQKPIIKTFETVLNLMGAPVKDLAIANTQPIENIFSEALIADILDTNELREIIGYEALEEQPEQVVEAADRDLVKDWRSKFSK